MATWALRRHPTIPREHGFWAMLLTVLVSALLRTPVSVAVAAVALAVLVVGIVFGGRFSSSVRRSSTAQLASSVPLAFSGAPVELAGGALLSSVIATTGAWVVLFASSCLIVRSAFARAGRAGANPWRSRGLAWLAVVLCIVASVGFYWMGLPVHAGVLLLGALGCALIACWQPSVKQLKPVGIALAVLISSCGVLLVLWAQNPAT